MPIPVQRSAPDRTESALSLVNKVLRDRQLGAVESIEGTDVKFEALKALEFLNEIEQRLYDAVAGRYGQDTWEEPLVVNKAAYDLPANWQTMQADPRLPDRQLRPLTVDEWYALADTRSRTGAPEYYILKDGQIVLWPAPDYAYLKDKIVYDGAWYACAVDHTSGTDHGDPTSPNATDWPADTDFDTEMDTWDAATSDYDTDDFAWATGAYYQRGYMDTPYMAGLTTLAANSDAPTLPAVFYPALVAGASWRLAMHLGEPDNRIAQLERVYLKLEHDRKIKAAIQDGPPNFIDVYPL